MAEQLHPPLITSTQLKVSSNDTTPDFLLAKLSAGSNVTLNELNDGANEAVEIVSTDEQIKISANDTTTAYLGTKLTSSLFDLNETNDGGDETLDIAANSSNVVSAYIHEEIYNTKLGSTGTFSITIPGSPSYEYIHGFASLRTDDANPSDDAEVNFNSDTNSANYQVRAIGVDDVPSAVLVDEASTDFIDCPAASANAGAFGYQLLWIGGYNDTNKKTVMHSWGGSYDSEDLRFRVTEWTNTATVTSIDIVAEDGTGFVTGSQVVLMGVRKVNLIVAP